MIKTEVTKRKSEDATEIKIFDAAYMRLQGVNPAHKGVIPIYTFRRLPVTMWQVQVTPDQMLPSEELTVTYFCPLNGQPFYCRETPEQILELIGVKTAEEVPYYYHFKDTLVIEAKETPTPSNVVEFKKSEEALASAVKENEK